MQVDPKAEATYGLTPYGAMNQNPISYADPNGDIGILATMGIYAAVNVTINAFQGNVNGVGDFLTHAAVGAVNGALSTINPLKLDLGAGFGLSLNPQIAVGTNGAGVGFNATAGWSKWGIKAGLSAGGTVYGTAAHGGAVGFEGRFGGGLSYEVGGLNSKWTSWLNGTSIGLSKMNFYSGETSQQTGMFSLGYRGGKLNFDNDLLGDGGDRFRTSGVSIGYKDFSLGLNMFTGDPGLENRRTASLGGDPNGTYIESNGNDPDKYRFGGLYFGYKGYRVGVNSEGVRNFFQNRLIHDGVTNSPHFRVLDNKWKPYFGHYTSNPYTSW